MAGVRVRKIISGGQTGADYAGLEIAEALGLETGGTAPKYWMTEDGPNPSLAHFGLKQSRDAGYKTRTRLNVQDSDATVIFGNSNSPGSRDTIEFCDRYTKPYIVIPAATPPQIARFRAWLIEKHVAVLNCAGNRASKHKTIATLVKTCIAAVIVSRNIEPPVPAGCAPILVSSRICERGTPGCVVEHDTEEGLE